MSTEVIALKLGNRYGFTNPKHIVLNDVNGKGGHGRDINHARLFISDHDHYATLVLANGEREAGGVYYLDAEDMDTLCQAWLAHRAATQTPPNAWQVLPETAWHFGDSWLESSTIAFDCPNCHKQHEIADNENIITCTCGTALRAETATTVEYRLPQKDG